MAAPFKNAGTRSFEVKELRAAASQTLHARRLAWKLHTLFHVFMFTHVGVHKLANCTVPENRRLDVRALP
jgi:hypothetical protein